MVQKQPIRLNEHIHLIDGFDLETPERTGSYILDEDQLTIIETGPSLSVKHVKEGLKDLGYTLEQVKYIIVTHVHLDHAGGAGLLLQDCPNATVVAHKKGARHLVDPTRLVKGAKMVYGDKFDDLFEPIVPIPEDRIIIKEEGETLEISPTCVLQFYDTPGHANHHFSIYDPVTNGMFTGDTVGIRYQQLVNDDVDLFLPSTSPNQFDPAAMQRAIDRMTAMRLDTIYYGHFGMTKEPDIALRQVAEWLVVFVEEAEAAAAKNRTPEELAKRLQDLVRSHLRELDVKDDHEVYEIINLDMEISAQGLMEYVSKKSQ